ncbi:ABC transporter permease subunit [Paenisporosarcina sp. TG-14]|uniref:ABC transporter permease subunit n=1 Tax=Paenisporosarcina sp. TG-14 TaxID=1231057 RepID=UPI001ED9ACA4|nr:ABC transporter permease subunit [Paenisporosarcina sp. TG-14]
MLILVASLLLSLISSFVLSFITLLSKGFIKKILLHIAKFLESFPDFSFIFLIQILVVQVYLKTDILILQFYSLGDNLVYIAPILCLSILPTLLLFKLFILLFEEEWGKSYVELARSKGLSNFEVLLKHCTTNVLKSLFFQSKSIVWLSLSSLLIIEYLFGINGILYYLKADFSPSGTTFILLSIFTPFFLVYAVAERIVDKEQIERNVIFNNFNLSMLNIQQVKSINIFRKKESRRGISETLKIVRINLFKYLNIIIPILIVFGLLLTSFLYFIFFNDKIDQINYIYNDEGEMESMAPHPPSSNILFGTDPFGYSILQQLIVGIKYTILITLIIATIRIVTGYLFAILYVFYLNNKLRVAINSIADGIHFLPLTLLTYILLIPILINSTGVWETTLTERLILQILIMSFVVLPVTTSSIGNEMNETLKKEYVQSSVVMGGSLIWILIKHINPQLWPKILLLWSQHIVQVLQMFVHLGILSIFVGGATYQSSELILNIYELSGMISISREVFMTKQYWMILPPLFTFMILIYCFNTIVNGISKKSIYLSKKG